MHGESKDYGLRPLWDATLDIYLAFRRICSAHRLRFWAYSGTLIGAIRHQGFIPWDDDFDVLMPFPDYKVFLKVASEELPSHLSLVTRDNTPEFRYHYSKIQDTRECVSDGVAAKTGHPQNEGIFIDIFPLYGAPRKRWYDGIRSAVYRMKNNAVVNMPFKTKKSLIAHWLGKMIFWLPDLKSQADFDSFIQSEVSEVPYESASLVARYLDYHFKFCFRMNRGYFSDTIEVPFEGTTVPVPREYDKVLKVMFGNYTKLPSESERCVVHSRCPPAPWKFGATGGRYPVQTTIKAL